MMKVLLLLGLLALAEARWVPDDSPLQHSREQEPVEKGSKLQELVISKFLRNLLKLDEDKELAAEYNRDVSLEEQAKGLEVSDAISGIQGDLGEDGEERRQDVAGGLPVSNPSGNPKEYGFMEVPSDTQPMDESFYRY